MGIEEKIDKIERLLLEVVSELPAEPRQRLLDEYFGWDEYSKKANPAQYTNFCARHHLTGTAV